MFEVLDSHSSGYDDFDFQYVMQCGILAHYQHLRRTGSAHIQGREGRTLKMEAAGSSDTLIMNYYPGRQ
jgi:hypothetical protein